MEHQAPAGGGLWKGALRHLSLRRESISLRANARAVGERRGRRRAGRLLVGDLSAATYTGAPLNICRPDEDEYDWYACADFNWQVLNSSFSSIVGSTASLQSQIDALSLSTASLAAGSATTYVTVSGDTMTGALTMSGAASYIVSGTSMTTTGGIFSTTLRTSSSLEVVGDATVRGGLTVHNSSITLRDTSGAVYFGASPLTGYVDLAQGSGGKVNVWNPLTVAGASVTFRNATDALNLDVINTAGRAYLNLQAAANNGATLQFKDASVSNGGFISWDNDASLSAASGGSGVMTIGTQIAGQQVLLQTGAGSRALVLDGNLAAHFSGSITALSSATITQSGTTGNANILGFKRDGADTMLWYFANRDLRLFNYGSSVDVLTMPYAGGLALRGATTIAGSSLTITNAGVRMSNDQYASWDNASGAAIAMLGFDSGNRFLINPNGAYNTSINSGGSNVVFGPTSGVNRGSHTGRVVTIDGASASPYKSTLELTMDSQGAGNARIATYDTGASAGNINATILMSGGNNKTGTIALQTSNSGGGLVTGLTVDSSHNVTVPYGLTSSTLTISAGGLNDGAIYGQDIAQSTITLNKLNASGCSSNQVPKYNGSTWACGDDNDSGATACPGGFTEVIAATRRLGCIQTAEEGSDNWRNANEDCFDTYGGRLPTVLEAYTGMNNYVLTDETDDNEWAFEGGGADAEAMYHDADDSLGRPSHQPINNSVAYRCWIPK
jgi:hypothetical protein